MWCGGEICLSGCRRTLLDLLNGIQQADHKLPEAANKQYVIALDISRTPPLRCRAAYQKVRNTIVCDQALLVDPAAVQYPSSTVGSSSKGPGTTRIVGPGSATAYPWSGQSAKLTLPVTVSNRQPLGTLQARANCFGGRDGSSLSWVRSSSDIED